jgi:hypothetical protein
MKIDIRTVDPMPVGQIDATKMKVNQKKERVNAKMDANQVKADSKQEEMLARM